MKPKVYKLLDRCVSDGVELGLSRAHKHTDTPSRDYIVEQVESAVMNEICEWFGFDELKE